MGFVCQPECKDLDRGQVGGLRLCPVQQTGKDQSTLTKCLIHYHLGVKRFFADELLIHICRFDETYFFTCTLLKIDPDTKNRGEIGVCWSDIW